MKEAGEDYQNNGHGNKMELSVLLKLFGFILLFVLVVLVVLEGFLSLKLKISAHSVEREWYIDQDFFQFSNIFGYYAKPNAKKHSYAKVKGEKIFDVVYTTDAFGRRITPENKLCSPGKNKFILCFGPSFTFGDGVNDNETMVYYISDLASSYRAYNYGFFSYGPQHMLAALEQENIHLEIPEKTGIAVYTFIDSSVNIAIGSMNVYNEMGGNMPFYTLDDKGNILKKGTFTSGRPVLSFIYFLLGKSQLIRYLNLDIPRVKESHIRLTAKIIEEARNRFRVKFGSNDFYVLFYPGSRYSSRIIPYLRDANIKYFDYSNLIDLKKTEYYIKGDLHAHPSPYAYAVIAKQFVQDAGLQ